MRAFTSIAAVLLCGFFSLDASARVTIVTDGPVPYAEGEMRTAATPPRPGAYIYCDFTGNVIACGASDGAGLSAYCFNDEYKYKRLFPAVGKTATVRFTWDPVDNRCTSLDVGNSNAASDVRADDAPRYDVVTVVEPAYSYAYGTMSAPRTGIHEQMGCSVRADLAYCIAVDKNDVMASCYIEGDSTQQTAEDMRQAAMGVNESSYVFFQWDNSLPQHKCIQIYVGNASYYLP